MKKDNWVIKISLVTLGLCTVVSLIANIASSKSGLLIAGMVIIFMLILSVLMDGVGVAVAACDIDKLKLAKVNNKFQHDFAVKMVANRDKVNNFCNDVIGDVCSVLNGACAAEIVVELMRFLPLKYTLLVTAIISSLVAALTVGGKAYVKTLAINRSQEFVLYSAKIVAIIKSTFARKNKNRKKQGK